MATALIYVLVLLAVAAAIFVGASALFGRGEELAPIPRGASPTWLPDTGPAAADVRAVRFQQAVRGYRMAEVDWVLDRVAAELERLDEEHGHLHRRIAELENPPAAELEKPPAAEPENPPAAELENPSAAEPENPSAAELEKPPAGGQPPHPSTQETSES